MKKIWNLGKAKVVKLFKSLWRKKKIVIPMLLLFTIAGLFLIPRGKGDNIHTLYSVEAVTRGPLKESISSSGSVKPLEAYSVTTTSNVEGTVSKADFEEGDKVKKGDLLYQISADNLDTKIDAAKLDLKRKKKSNTKAIENYEKGLKKYSQYTVEAEESGYVRTLNVKKGDSIAQGSSELGELFNNKTMLLNLPFIESDISAADIGKKATVSLTNSDEELEGIVTKVNDYTESIGANRVVRFATIEVKNPGGIRAGDSGQARVGKLVCSEDGIFSLKEESKIIATVSGTVGELCVNEGQWVSKGDTLLRLREDTYDSELSTLESQMDAAQIALEDAQTTLDSLLDTKKEFTITSPITGTVINKQTKVGDTISTSVKQDFLCKIYNLSAMLFPMKVDEADVTKVQLGQTVQITPETDTSTVYEGVVTNVSIDSETSEGGVTKYPVTVRLDHYGSLLPGMNVTGEIVVQETEDTLMVPTGALMRGDCVYIQDATAAPEEGVPEGFRSQSVKVGMTDGVNIELLEGVNEGDMVYVLPDGSEDMGMPYYGY